MQIISFDRRGSTFAIIFTLKRVITSIGRKLSKRKALINAITLLIRSKQKIKRVLIFRGVTVRLEDKLCEIRTVNTPLVGTRALASGTNPKILATIK